VCNFLYISKKTKQHNALLCCILFFLLTSCNTTKFVSDGDFLLNKVTIKTDVNDISRDELNSYLRQTPNTATLGLLKLNLHIYNISGCDSTKWRNRFWRKLGSKPVIYNSALTSISRQQLELVMRNKGFFNATVRDSVVLKNKKANVFYNIKSENPYRLRNYSADFTNRQLSRIASDTTRSYIRPNMLFDVDILEKERNRIATIFRQTGYYFFNKDLLSYTADSTYNSNQIDLSIGLNENLKNAPQTYQKAVFKRYRIRNVYFFTNNNENQANNADSVNTTPDTVSRGNYFLISNRKSFIRFNTLIINTSIVPQMYFSDYSVDRTYASLNAIPAIRYIDLNFNTVGDSLLDCKINVTPAKQINFSLGTEMTYTEGFWGVAGNLSTQHKNVFGGGEVLSLRLRTAVERQVEVWAQEYGGQVGLQFPNFLMPFVKEQIKRRIRATTAFSANINYQFRPAEYTLTNIGAGLKYSWNLRQNRNTLDLFDLNYVYFPNISDGFYQKYIASGIYNRYNYESHFIMRLAYSNTYSGFSAARPLKNFVSYIWNIESAGNLLYSISKISNAPKGSNGLYQIFKIPFAQYVKGFVSVSYNQIFDAGNRVVYRAALGIATPYGNANIIPYERRFFSGGANSVRGWGENTLGPGAYKRVTAYGHRDFNQSGDIKLDLNMEVRSKLFWRLESALFLDAGNVWTIRNYEQQKDGVFSFSNFYNQIAMAYGVGVRADFSYFLLRVDLGVKLYNPSLDRRSAWRTSPTFRDDFALHLAIGYPF